tara:strand:+ start:518 stop:691 length:174 start_codon:yes stop_codon:yes gene_type:complete
VSTSDNPLGLFFFVLLFFIPLLSILLIVVVPELSAAYWLRDDESLTGYNIASILFYF